MAKKTFQALQDEVLFKLGFELGQSTDLDAKVKGWLNEGQRHLLLQAWWPWSVDLTSFATTAGAHTYPLVAEARGLKKNSTRLLKENNYANVVLVPRSKADEFLPNAVNTTGTPIRCWLKGFNASGQWQLQLHPTPDATYTFEYGYYARAAALSLSSDTLKGPEEADEVVRDYALWKAFEHVYGEADPQAIQQALRSFMEGMANLELFVNPDHENQHFAPPWDLYDFADSVTVDLNTNDPLDMT